jgi:hypothetical protein
VNPWRLLVPRIDIRRAAVEDLQADVRVEALISAGGLDERGEPERQ